MFSEMKCSSFCWLFVSQNGFHSTSQVGLSVTSFIAHSTGKIADHLKSSLESEELPSHLRAKNIKGIFTLTQSWPD